MGDTTPEIDEEVRRYAGLLRQALAREINSFGKASVIPDASRIRDKTCMLHDLRRRQVGGELVDVFAIHSQVEEDQTAVLADRRGRTP